MLHVLQPLPRVVERLQEHDERKDGLVGIDAGNHRQQGGDVEGRHRAADAPPSHRLPNPMLIEANSEAVAMSTEK